jgi:deoxyribodipyrimidine photo-lyase
MIFENGLFIFRRDLRIIDNNSLNIMNSKCKNIYTIFIFTPEQVSNSNKYKSYNAIQFMIESLENLYQEINNSGGKLYTFYGDNNKIISYLIERLNIDYLSFNIDITPYAMERDRKIKDLCEKKGCEIECYHDYYLNPPGTIFNSSDEPYRKFTPYYNVSIKKHIQPPLKIRILKFHKTTIHLPNQISLTQSFSKFLNNYYNEDISVNGGRDNAIICLNEAKKTQHNYSKTHNLVYRNTTLLSAYIKFGCISIREVYKTFRSNHDLIRQLIWRDFYANILFNYPYVLEHPMKKEYSKIKWHNNSNYFNAWKSGKTGFPIVDAGMRQMNTTGYMHNRSRLIVSSFLIKTLLINWKNGEKYFANKLVDYDPANNNLNWQWIASTAVDSQPYFRIFNPWLQQEEFDEECEYIKKWVPELIDVPPKDIHKWYDSYENHKNIKYNKPICDYYEQKEKALKMYKDALY